MTTSKVSSGAHTRLVQAHDKPNPSMEWGAEHKIPPLAMELLGERQFSLSAVTSKSTTLQ